MSEERPAGAPAGSPPRHATPRRQRAIGPPGAGAASHGPAARLRVLLVCADPTLGRRIEAQYGASEVAVTSVAEPERAADLLADEALSADATRERFRAVVLVAGEADDPTTTLRELRCRTPTIPVIAAVGGGERERVAALDHGADDALSLPLSEYELTARLRALLRRGSRAPKGGAAPPPPPEDVVRFRDGLAVSVGGRWASWRGERINLTHREAHLLVLLLSRAPGAVSREEMIETVWKRPAHWRSRSVDTCVFELRRKLAAQGGAAWRVVAVRGVGYAFDPRDRESPQSD